jgi:hypothetical protein
LYRYIMQTPLGFSLSSEEDTMRARTAKPLRVLLVVGGAMLMTSGCTSGGDRMNRDDSGPTQPGGPAMHQLTAADLRQIAGVDVLPRLLNAPELAASMKRNYPANLRGTGTAGSVLVDVVIDDHGRVTGVSVLPAPQTEARAIRSADLEHAGQPMEAASEASTARFGAAAAACLHAAQFSPARLDGKAVPFTMRMTVRFTDPG